MADIDIQDVDSKKQYLKRYKKNLALIDRLKNKVIVLDERSKSLKSPGYSDMPRGGTPITYEDLVAEKDEILRRIKRLEVKGKKLKDEILDKIDELEDVRYVEVLESFFIDCKSFEDIAKDNGYTVRHVVKLYSKGVKLIDLGDQLEDGI